MGRGNGPTVSAKMQGLGRQVERAARQDVITNKSEVLVIVTALGRP